MRHMTQRFSLRQLEYLVAVGETGSIAGASGRVNVSSPSISAAISQLEAEFGVQLFVRKHAHGLSLTSAGRRFLVEARRVLGAAEGLNDLASDLSGSVRGPLSIGCLLTFAQHVLPELRRRFQDSYPDVAIAQTEAHQGQIFELIRRAEIDLALTYDLEIPADLEFEPLAELPLYVVLAAGHALADREYLTVDELLPLPMILLDLPYSGAYFLSVFQDTKPLIAERTGDMGVLRAMVANGFGFALANIRPVSDTAPDGKPLVCVPLRGKIRPMKLGILTVRTRHKPRLIAAFEGHCRSLITQGSVPGLRMRSGPSQAVN